MNTNSWPIWLPRPLTIIRGIANVWIYDSFIMPILQVVRIASGDRLSPGQWEGVMMSGCLLLIPIFAGFHWGIGKILDSLYSGWGANYPMKLKDHWMEGLIAFNVAWFVLVSMIIIGVLVIHGMFTDVYNNILLGEEPLPDDKWETIGEFLAVFPYCLAVFLYHIGDLFTRFRDLIWKFANKPIMKKPEKLPFYQRNKSTIRRKKRNQ